MNAIVAPQEAIRTAIERVDAGANEMLGELIKTMDDRKRAKLMSGMYEIIRKAPENEMSMQALVQAPESVLRVGFIAANNDLSLNVLNRELYAVPRFNGKTKRMEFTPQIGYMAPIKFLERTGLYAQPNVVLVYDGCEVEVDRGNLMKPLRHVPWHIAKNIDYETAPDKAKAERGNLRFAYLLAASKTVGGAPLFEIVEPREIKRGFDASKMQGTWKANFDEMAKKTAAIRACRFVPMREEDREVVMREYVELSSGDFTDIPEPKTETLNEQLNNEPDPEDLQADFEKKLKEVKDEG